MPQINFTWWNLQNFFDTDDDPISLDFEYTPAHGWTQERFEQKRDNLARALAATHDGQGPHLLAVAEIEKDGLLEQVIAAMGNSRLKVAVDRTGTRDLRGIDVAVAYDRDLFELVEQRSHVVHLRYRTRDIFELVLRLKATGELLVVIAGHWPSRKRGQFESEPLRCAVAENIAFLVESHVKVGVEEYEQLRGQNDLGALQAKWRAKLLVVGDFNDQPFDRSLVEHLKASKDLGFVTGTRNDIGGFTRRWPTTASATSSCTTPPPASRARPNWAATTSPARTRSAPTPTSSSTSWWCPGACWRPRACVWSRTA